MLVTGPVQGLNYSVLQEGKGLCSWKAQTCSAGPHQLVAQSNAWVSVLYIILEFRGV